MSYTNKYLPGVALQTPQEVAAYIAANPGDERARWWKIAPSPQNPLGLTTDDIPEGLANLYYNPSRVTKEIQDAVDGLAIPVASDADPMALGVADPGASDEFSRGDHVHPMPSAVDVGAEPAISGGTAAQYLNGLKAWADFATSVRDTMLVGLSTASSAIITFGDTVLSALGKLQAQITLRLPINNPTFTGTMQGPYLRISSLASGLNGVPVSNFVGELSVKTADQFRTYASCAYSGDIGQSNGIASLDATGRVPSGQLPSYVDDVLEFANFAALPATGETGKIYVTQNDNKTWRWSGSAYVEISASLALGETPSTAYRGDRGKIAYDHSQSIGNPHGASIDDIVPGFIPTSKGGTGVNSIPAGHVVSVGESLASLQLVQKTIPYFGTTGQGFWPLQFGTGLVPTTGADPILNLEVRNAQIPSDAGIAWTKISKAGAVPGDVGAASVTGVTNGSDASAGNVGEYLESLRDEASAVYAVNGSAVSILSLSLPAGDWIVEGRATAFITGAMSGNTVVSGLNASVAIPTDGTEVYGGQQVFSSTNAFQTMTGSKRFSLTTTTTVYLVGRIDFGAGTPKLFGCMSARRTR